MLHLPHQTRWMPHRPSPNHPQSHYLQTTHIRMHRMPRQKRRQMAIRRGNTRNELATNRHRSAPSTTHPPLVRFRSTNLHRIPLQGEMVRLPIPHPNPLGRNHHTENNQMKPKSWHLVDDNGKPATGSRLTYLQNIARTQHFFNNKIDRKWGRKRTLLSLERWHRPSIIFPSEQNQTN